MFDETKFVKEARRETKERSEEPTWSEGRYAVHFAAAASLECEGRLELIDAEVMADDLSDAFFNKAACGTIGTETSQDPGGAQIRIKRKGCC